MKLAGSGAEIMSLNLPGGSTLQLDEVSVAGSTCYELLRRGVNLVYSTLHHA